MCWTPSPRVSSSPGSGSVTPWPTWPRPHDDTVPPEVLPGVHAPVTTSVKTVVAIWAVEGALLLGIVLVLLTAFNRVRERFANGTRAAVAGALLASMNTASEYGFGGVIAALPGFIVVSDALKSIPNPLVNAVHLAFATHYPLRLTPDAIWTTIAQGFGLHIRLNAEALRGQFVDHQGKKELPVEVLQVPTTEEEWAGLVSNWCSRIREHVGVGAADFFLNTFSTSGSVERTVSEIKLSGLVARETPNSFFDETLLRNVSVQ